MPHNGNHLPGLVRSHLIDDGALPAETTRRSPSGDLEAPQKSSFTDPEKLRQAIEEWQARDWNFEALGLVVPTDSAPFMVAGTNPLSCQFRLDDAVRSCCNITHRFGATWGHPAASWTGTVCDLSAARKDTHTRNEAAESIITALAVESGMSSFTGPLYGMVGLHRTGELPEVIRARQAVRLLRLAASLWNGK